MIIQKILHKSVRGCSECGRPTNYILLFGRVNTSGHVPLCNDCLLKVVSELIPVCSDITGTSTDEAAEVSKLFLSKSTPFLTHVVLEGYFPTNLRDECQD